MVYSQIASQQIQNCLSRTVVQAPKFSHILILNWLKINERIDYELLSLTYKVLTSSQPAQSDLCSVYMSTICIFIIIVAYTVYRSPTALFRHASPYL